MNLTAGIGHKNGEDIMGIKLIFHQLLCVQEHSSREWQQPDGVQHLPESLPPGASAKLLIFLDFVRFFSLPGVPQPSSEQ